MKQLTVDHSPNSIFFSTERAQKLCEIGIRNAKIMLIQDIDSMLRFCGKGISAEQFDVLYDMSVDALQVLLVRIEDYSHKYWESKKSA